MNSRACPSNPLVLAAIFAAHFAISLWIAAPAAAQTVTVQMRDAGGWSFSYYQEFQPITFRVEDSGRAGAGSIEVLVESALRGDEEWLVLTEQPTASGIFSKVLATTATLDPAPPAHSDGTLEVTELAGPPLQRDTLQLHYPDCSLPVCPSAQASMVGPTIRLVDSGGYDLYSFRPAGSLNIQVIAHAADSQPTLDVTVSGGGDSEVVTLQKVAGAGRFSGSKFVDFGPAVPGDGLLRVSLGITLTASLPEPLGLAEATDTVTVAENRVRFADVNGNRAFLLMNGPIQVYYESQAANLSSSAIDTYSLGVGSLYSLGQRDYETLVLTETGIATGIFTGQLWNEIVSGPGIAGDGLLQVQAQDTIQVFAGAMGIAERMINGLLRFTSASGDDVSEIHPGTVYLEALSYLANEDENAVDHVTVGLGSDGNPDDIESFQLTEQGPDSNIFRGSISSRIGPPTRFNSLIEALQGETLEADLSMGVVDRVLLVADPDNQPPVAEGDSIATSEDQAALIDPLANDSDPDDDPLTFQFTQAAHGSVARDAGDPQKLRYTPVANYFGSDSFTYTVSDPGGATATATVDVTVVSVDDPPVAANDSVVTSEDVSVLIRARLNDSDPEGDAITVVRFDARSAHGTIVAQTGTYDFRYYPDANWYGTDSFTYDIEAGGKQASATVSLMVASVADPPVAVADSATTVEETPVVIAVLLNDRDDDGQTFTLSSATATSPATAVANANGTVTYTPGPNVFGTRTFTYRIRDSTGSLSSSATVTVTITNVNDPPVAVNDTLGAPEDVPTALNVKANDTDPDSDALTVVGVTQPSHGTVTLASGVVSYLSHLNYNGPDSFTYTVADPSGLTSTATVNLTSTAVNDAPVGVADAVTTPEDTQVIIDALANDVDVDGNTLNFSSWGSPTKGTLAVVTLNGRSQFRYTPNLNTSGSDSFTYRAYDPGGLATALTTVSITVTPVNDPPTAVNDAATTAEDTAVTINVLANDSDLEGNPLSVVGYTLGGGATGTVTINPNQTLTYLPGLNYFGTAGFIDYQLSDGTLTATGKVTLNVTPVNDPPITQPDAVTVLEDQVASLFPLANDSDDSAGQMSLQFAFAIVGGSSASVNTVTGQATFTPHPNFNGTGSFSYRVQDSTGLTSVGTVTVTVLPVNDAPQAAADAATVAEDTPITVAVLANDSDVDGDTLAITLVGTPQHGMASFGAGGVTYTPAADWSGVDSFSYTIGDGNGGSATANLTVTVTAVNDSPVAVADAYSLAEDGTGTFAVLANDSDPENQSLTVGAAGGAANGSVTFTASGVTYVPAADWSGTDSFSYTARDASGATATATVTVTVTPVNDSPVAVADSATTDEEVAVTVEVLANDSDPDGDSLAVVAATAGGNGSAGFGAGSVTFTPAADFTGTATVEYTVSDGNGGTAQGMVTITVTGVNDSPVAVPDAYTLAEDGSGTFAVLANDGDPDGQQLTVTAAGGAAHGAVSFAAGSVTYSPAADWNGADSFSYTASDPNGETATATVTITVTAVADPPVAVADAITVAEDGSAVVNALANDSDPDGDTLSIAGASQPAHGSVVLAGGVLTYTPAANYSGPDAFTYTASDGGGGSATATVGVTVTGENDGPVAGPDSASTSEDTPLTFAPLGNDSDPDGDSLAIEAITAATGGSASATATTITFTPAANFSGTATVSFTITDGHGGSAASLATIAVSPVNDAPVAVADAGTVAEDGSLTLQPLLNDSDLETPAGLAITGVTPAAHGAVGFTAGTVVYTPAANWSGADAFSYTLADGQGGTATASISIVVTAVNDAPVAAGDSAVTTAGSSVTVAVLANDSDLEGTALVVSSVGAPLHGSAVRNANDTVSYNPAAGYSGADSFTYTVSDGAASATATVSVTVNNALGQVAVLGLRSLQLEAGSDVLSGDVVVNAAEPPPFLGATEVAIGTAVTVAAGWDVRGNGVTIAAGTTIRADVTSNTLANSGTILGSTFSPLALPVFASLPVLQTGTPGASDVNVAQNGAITLAPGVYRDLLVARKGVVTFTGGVYVFRSVVIQREASLLFSAPSTVKVEQKMSTATMTHIKPAPVSTATAATIVFHIAGINGTNGALASTPKPLEIATDNVLAANFYVPNGTLWLQARTLATGAFIGRHVRIGPDVQVGLASAW